MRRRLLIFAAAFAALPAGVALAAIAAGNFSGHGTDQPQALFTLTVNGTNHINQITSNFVKFKCDDGAHGKTTLGTIGIGNTANIPIQVDNSFSTTFSGNSGAITGKVFGFFPKADVAKATYKETLILQDNGQPDVNGPHHCHTGAVPFKVKRQ